MKIVFDKYSQTLRLYNELVEIAKNKQVHLPFIFENSLSKVKKCRGPNTNSVSFL